MLSLIIPAYNEASNIGPVIRSLFEQFDGERIVDYELIVVNDGSSDATGEVAREFARKNARVIVVDHPVNRGIGAAIKSGLQVAKGDYICVSSADGEIAPEDIVQLYRLSDGIDMVTSARRRIKLQNRNLISGVHNLLIRILFGYAMSGREGIYVVRKSLLDDAQIVSDTSLANLELLMHAARKAKSTRTGEITVRSRLSGKSKVANVRSIVRVMGDMVVLRFKKWYRMFRR